MRGVAQVGERHDVDDALNGSGGAAVDAQDFRVGMGAPDHMRVQRAGKIDIVDEYPFPGQKFVILRPFHRRADKSQRCRLLGSMRRARRQITARCLDNGVDNILIAGAAAQIAGNRLADFRFGQRPLLLE